MPNFILMLVLICGYFPTSIISSADYAWIVFDVLNIVVALLLTIYIMLRDTPKLSLRFIFVSLVLISLIIKLLVYNYNVYEYTEIKVNLLGLVND